MKRIILFFLLFLFIVGCSTQKNFKEEKRSTTSITLQETSTTLLQQIIALPTTTATNSSSSSTITTSTTSTTNEKTPKNIKEQNATKKKESWWHPQPGLTWQWQLQGNIKMDYDVDVYDLDLFDTPQEVIDKLHKQGKKIICYFSAGSWEAWRPDAKEFPKQVLGKPLEDWPDERWLDIAHYEQFAKIMKKRLDVAQAKQCDAVEPDNIDGYQNENGFGFSAEEQVQYNRWLAEEAHKRGLAIGLKNDLLQVKELVDDFDFAINEQCFQYNECDKLFPFIKQQKAVFGVEYELEPAQFCPKANALGFSWLKMTYALSGERIGCEKWQ